MIKYSEGLSLSMTLVERLSKTDLAQEIDILIDTFKNGRETGYCLKTNRKEEWDYSKSIVLWIHSHRNTNEIVIRWGRYSDCNGMNMYNEKVYQSQTQRFPNGDEDQAVKYIVDLLQTELK